MFRKIVKQILILASAINIIILSACSSVSNLTPHKVVENENGLYTLSMASKVKDNSLVLGSERAYIVIDGQKHPMKTVLNLKNEVMYQYDYSFPKNKNAVSYYYLVEYKARTNHGRLIEKRTLDSGEMFVLRPITKFISGLKADRGAVGSSIEIDGSGFDSADVVLVGDKPALTTCVSPKLLEFVVPSIDSGKRYDVEIKHSDGNVTWVGSFFVRSGELLVSPSRISRESGQTINMIFDIGFKAPAGGYYVDVQTNIPSSVIMPEVMIAEGESSVAVPVKFASAGNGSLYVNAVGFGEKVIPLTINASAVENIGLINDQSDEVSENALNAPTEIEESKPEENSEAASLDEIKEAEETIIIEVKE